MNTVSINELWSIFLLHSFLHGISKAFKEKLSQLYPRKYLFLITTLRNSCIWRIYAKTISKSMLGNGKIPTFCLLSVCKWFWFFSKYWGLAEWLPFLVHHVKWLFFRFVSTLALVSNLQAAAWGENASVQPMSRAVQRSVMPRARAQGKVHQRSTHTYLFPLYLCRW